jgi:hypothetical protein
MPRLPIDYSKTIIYKLVSKDLSVKDCYVGATTNWTNRKYRHKNNCKNENNEDYNLKVYQYIRANGGFENWLMIMVEKFPCETEHESAKRERYWTEMLGATLNSQVQGRTNKEWREANKEKIKEQTIENYKQNKEQILEKRVDYYEKNKEQILEKFKEKYTCECGLIICNSSKSRHNKSKKHIKFQANEATA